MAEFNKVLYAIDTGISPQEFERLCLDMLCREGYRHIVPGGRTNDLGRDAEVRFWCGESGEFAKIVFQFSLEKNWERKLKTDAAKVSRGCQGVKAMVFVTSRDVTVAKRQKLESEFRKSSGWQLQIFDREWFRLRLEQRDQDLAKKYFGLDLPVSSGHMADLVALTDFDRTKVAELFKHGSPETVRAALIESTRKEPESSHNWKQLSRLEYYLRNYEEALEGINRCLELEPKDGVAHLNSRLFKGAILAEWGVAKRSRPLLIQARDILCWAVQCVKRPTDHYNFANVLSALGELQEAEQHYRICLERDPRYAQGWTNLANLLLQMDRASESMDCYEKALALEPNLVEAHLSKARAYLLYLDNPEAAVESFERVLPLIRKGREPGDYIRYWYAQSLAAVGRLEEALVQANGELVATPGDKYLLKLKFDILARLWRKNPDYEIIALEFLRFRTRAVKHDYLGLCDLIHLCIKRGLADEAWGRMQANVDYGGFSIRAVAEKSGLCLADFAEGFANIRLYGQFRRTHPLEYHCVVLTQHGVTPNLPALACLDQAIAAPFGCLANRMRAFSKGDRSVDLKAAFLAATKTISKLWADFGTYWLATEAPAEQEEQVRRLTVGMVIGFESLVTEVARQFGYLGGCFGLAKDDLTVPRKCKWRTIQTDFAVDLMEQVMTEWKMIKTGNGTPDKGLGSKKLKT